MVTADEARRELARRELERRRGKLPTSTPDERDSVLGRVDAIMRGVADTLTFGFADEIAAGLGTGFGLLGDYDAELARQRGIDQSDYENRFGYRLGGQLGGGVGLGVGMAGAGMSAAANAARTGEGLGRVAAGSAVDSALLGGLHGLGSGEGLEGRTQGAIFGGVTGLGVGAVAPFAVAGAGAALKPIAAPLMSRLRPEQYANKAMGEGLRRAGMTPDDVAAALARSQADDQGMYTVADAMGHTGRRLLSTVARNPNDMRQTVVDTLIERQLGQGDRLSSFLARGFDAPDTAAQREAALRAARDELASVNYSAARQAAGRVDPTRAIAVADDFLEPGVMGVARPATNIADDSIEAAVRRARSYLTDGNSILTDFNAALRAKQELDAMIEGAKPSVQRRLILIRNALDDALADASPQYAAARDAFRQQSRTVDAVEAGRKATSSRLRASDTIPQFNAMTAGEQNAFRAGYVDPLIARVESMTASPTTNRARPLLSDKMRQEISTFAVPRRAARLQRQISREQRMFETANEALGGSKTADNLADAAEMGKFDPGVLAGLLRGSIRDVLSSVGQRIANEVSGMSPRVIERVAETLIETRPDVARHLLETGAETAAQNELRNTIAALLIGSGAGATAGRLGAGRRPLEITVTRGTAQ